MRSAPPSSHGTLREARSDLLSDGTVIRRAREGDGSALTAVLVELRPLILRVAQHRLVRQHQSAYDLAEDLTQLTLLRVVAGLPQCRAETPAQLIRWTLTIVNRALLDLYRDPLSELSECRLSIDTVVSDREHPSVAGDVAETALSDIGHTETGEDGAAVSGSGDGVIVLRMLCRAALEPLDHMNREILWLRAVSRASWPEIATTLGVTETAAKRRYQRLQVRLRRDVARRVQALPARQLTSVLMELRRWGVDTAGL